MLSQLAAASLAFLSTQAQSPWHIDYNQERGECAAARFGANEDIEILLGAGGHRVYLLTRVPLMRSEYREFQIDGRTYGAVFAGTPQGGASVVYLDEDQVQALRAGSRLSYTWQDGSFSASLSGSNAAIRSLLDCARRADSVWAEEEQQRAASAQIAQQQQQQQQQQQRAAAALAAAQQQELLALQQYRQRLENQRQGDALMRLGLGILQGASPPPQSAPQTQVFTTPRGTIVCTTTGNHTNCN